MDKQILKFIYHKSTRQADEEIKEDTCYIIESKTFPLFKFFTHKNFDGKGWNIYEYSTGRCFTSADRKKDIETEIDNFFKYTRCTLEQLKMAINKWEKINF